MPSRKNKDISGGKDKGPELCQEEYPSSSPGAFVSKLFHRQKLQKSSNKVPDSGLDEPENFPEDHPPSLDYHASLEKKRPMHKGTDQLASWKQHSAGLAHATSLDNYRQDPSGRTSAPGHRNAPSPLAAHGLEVPGAYPVMGPDYVPDEDSLPIDRIDSHVVEGITPPQPSDSPEDLVQNALVRRISSVKEITRSKWFYIGLAVVVLLLAAISVGVGVGVSAGNNSNKSKDPPTPSQSLAPTSVPTSSPYPTIQGNEWVQVGRDLDGAKGDQFGFVASLSGDGSTVAVAGAGQENQPAYVNTYRLQNSIWTQVAETLYQDVASDVYLSFDGSRMVIGTQNLDSELSGEVRIYEWNGSWTLMGEPVSKGTNLYGFSVCISGDGSVIAITDPTSSSADGSEENVGRVDLLQWVGGFWIPLGQFIFGEAANDVSGTDVSLSFDGSAVAIGARDNDGSGGSEKFRGHVRVYEYVMDSWIQQGNDLDAHPSFGEDFGAEVALSHDGSVLAVGDPEYSASLGARSGSVQVYEYDGSLWRQLGETIVGRSLDLTGTSLSISSDGSVVAFGAPGVSILNSSPVPGSVSVLGWVGDSWSMLGPRLQAETENGGLFGYAVSISADGRTLAVGDPTNQENGIDAGSVQVFELG